MNLAAQWEDKVPKVAILQRRKEHDLRDARPKPIPSEATWRFDSKASVDKLDPKVFAGLKIPPLASAALPLDLIIFLGIECCGRRRASVTGIVNWLKANIFQSARTDFDEEAWMAIVTRHLKWDSRFFLTSCRDGDGSGLWAVSRMHRKEFIQTVMCNKWFPQLRYFIPQLSALLSNVFSRRKPEVAKENNLTMDNEHKLKKEASEDPDENEKEYLQSNLCHRDIEHSYSLQSNVAYRLHHNTLSSTKIEPLSEDYGDLAKPPTKSSLQPHDCNFMKCAEKYLGRATQVSPAKVEHDGTLKIVLGGRRKQRIVDLKQEVPGVAAGSIDERASPKEIEALMRELKADPDGDHQDLQSECAFSTASESTGFASGSRKRGRPRMTPEEKAEAARKRALTRQKLLGLAEEPDDLNLELVTLDHSVSCGEIIVDDSVDLDQDSVVNITGDDDTDEDCVITEISGNQIARHLKCEYESEEVCEMGKETNNNVCSLNFEEEIENTKVVNNLLECNQTMSVNEASSDPGTFESSEDLSSSNLPSKKKRVPERDSDFYLSLAFESVSRSPTKAKARLLSLKSNSQLSNLLSIKRKMNRKSFNFGKSSKKCARIVDTRSSKYSFIDTGEAQRSRRRTVKVPEKYR